MNIKENSTIITSPEVIQSIIVKALKEAETNKQDKQFEIQLFTINQTTKLINLSWKTIDNLVKKGKIGVNMDGLITGAEIKKYLTITNKNTVS